MYNHIITNKRDYFVLIYEWGLLLHLQKSTYVKTHTLKWARIRLNGKTHTLAFDAMRVLEDAVDIRVLHCFFLLFFSRAGSRCLACLIAD